MGIRKDGRGLLQVSKAPLCRAMVSAIATQTSGDDQQLVAVSTSSELQHVDDS